MLGIKATNEPIYVQVMQKIKESLLRGDYRPGDKIPSETELSKIFKVSRTSIREAIKTLVTVGILEIHRGKGTFVVTKVPAYAINPLLSQFIARLNLDNLDKLIEFRYIFETSYFKLVIDNLTDDNISQLWAIHNRAKELSKLGFEAYKKVDIEFHKNLLKCTRNEFVIQMGNMLMEIFEVIMDKSLIQPEGLQQSLAAHKSILDALKNRDLNKINKIIKSSLYSILSFYHE